MIKDYYDLPKKVWIYSCSAILFSLSSSIIPFLILFLNKEFNFNITNSSIYFCIIILLLVPASILGGKIGTKWSKKKIIIILRFFYAFCLVLCAQSFSVLISLSFLIMAMILMGVSRPIINSFVFDMIPKEKSQTAYSLVYMAESIGGIISPLITGLLFNNIKFLFILFGLSTILGCAVIGIFIPPISSNKKFDCNKSNVIYKDKKGNFKRIFNNHILLTTFLCFIVYEFCYGQQSYSLPLQMYNTFLDGAKYYGYLVSFNSFLLLLLTPFITSYLKKISPLTALIISGGFCGVGFGFLYYAKSIWEIFILVILWTIGEILYSICSFLSLNNILKNKDTSVASAIILSARSVGICLCSFLSGFIANSKDISFVWTITFILSILTGLILFSLRKEFNK
jgi:MFS family permease